MPGHTAAVRRRGTLSRPCRDLLTCGFSPGRCNSRELSYRIVVRVGMAGGDLDVPEVHAGIKHGRHICYLYLVLKNAW